MRTKTTLLCAAALTGALLAAGCISKPAPSLKLYVLPTSAPVGDAPDRGILSGKVLGIGPVDVVSHLDRQYVAVRMDDTRYEYADSMRWAAPVASMVSDRLAEALIWATGARDVRTFPWEMGNEPDVHVMARLVRFELTASGTAELNAYYALRDPLTRETRASGYFTREEPVEGTGTAAGVAALDRALVALAREIAGKM